ncbi:NAD(P)-dependent oxidoreductase [Mycoplasmopsis felifaucium]|uniref:NAD(P)-dependent oxidoreductase n=1 Tax=Mycoplasmopsis felifaucium TaxID=35768 RepID=UPI000484462C|nr:NAD(P)-dependent oxidoreductase [Mycoplasmopsis felifaucium]
MKVAAFSVREIEKSYFIASCVYSRIELIIFDECLTCKNIEVLNGVDAVIIRADSYVDEVLIRELSLKGVKYILTRTTGYEHIDLKACVKYQIRVANVPSYSPSAISEWAFSCAISLSRRLIYFANKANNDDLTITLEGFSYELKNKTVGIVGLGNIGLTTAKYFKAFNSDVIGYDPYPSQKAIETVKLVKSLNELVKKSDIVIFHCPYIKDVNDKIINYNLLKQAKEEAIFINASRGQIQDEQDILKALKENLIYAYATDVLNNEKEFFGKKDIIKNNETIKQLNDLYPRFLLTPHIGSYTNEAVQNMVEISLQNLKDFDENNTCKNEI